MGFGYGGYRPYGGYGPYGGYDGYSYPRYGGGYTFALIVVLFILLIIVGTAYIY